MSGCVWSRRQFLKLAGGTAGITAAGGAGLLAGSLPTFLRAAAGPGNGTKVAIASGASAADNARRAVDALGGVQAFVSRGDVVVLKPNIGWDRSPEQAANTNPDVVIALAEMCLSAGAKEVRVFDRTCNEPRRCYINSGIQQAVEEFAKKHHAGDTLRIYHVEDRKFQRTDISGALALNSWDLYRDALEADKIINIPVAKHHTLANVTLALKNMMGVMGGNRGQIHFRLPDCLVDINRKIPTHLAVIDATRILLRNGPSGGNLADVKAVGKVIASADVVAVDIVAANRLFGLSPDEVPHIRTALTAGLGVISPAEIRAVEV
ncbi:MAG TPA: DUF362 domain-containing protein [Candidatus Limnocylindria bacterium]|nr:DUF362 domain-containing protein [Candidatus Limnocylindria bacterium]